MPLHVHVKCITCHECVNNTIMGKCENCHNAAMHDALGGKNTNNSLQRQMDIIENNVLAIAADLAATRIMGLSLDRSRIDHFLEKSLDATLSVKEQLGLFTRLKKEAKESC